MTEVDGEKRNVGGSNAVRGIEFQARTSAIVMAHVLCEHSIGWLEGILDDKPIEIDAETGGPGDDVRFLTAGGARIELQAKQGLERGKFLWRALLLSRFTSTWTKRLTEQRRLRSLRLPR